MGDVWPVANARQWVLSFPHQVRYWLSRDTALFTDVMSAVTGVIANFYENYTLSDEERANVYAPSAGAVSFVQLFGSSLVLNPHLHLIFLDGVYGRGSDGLRFYPHPSFTTEAMFDVLYAIHDRLSAVFRRRGYVRDDGEAAEPEHVDDISMPFRPRAPKSYRRKGRLLDHANYQHSDPDQMSMEGWCNVRYKWLSLHAGVAIKGEDRDGLKRLFRYAARSSVAVSQLSYVTPEDPDRSDVELKLKRSWRDGTGSLVFTQRDFVEKLASLVPPPWFNLTRYYGVFASAHVWREFIVPMGRRKKRLCPAHDEPEGGTPPPPTKPSTGRAPAEYWIPWPELLRRTIGVDPEICVCGAKMIADDAITEPEKITETLARLGIKSTGPPKAMRSTGELDYIYDC